jgi:hypothetical protein
MAAGLVWRHHAHMLPPLQTIQNTVIAATAALSALLLTLPT